MNKDKVLISTDELKRLKAREVSLYANQIVLDLCPVCKKATLLDGLFCPKCGYVNSSSVEEWKQMNEDKN